MYPKFPVSHLLADSSAATGSALSAIRNGRPAPGRNFSILCDSSFFAFSVRVVLPWESSFTHQNKLASTPFVIEVNLMNPPFHDLDILY